MFLDSFADRRLHLFEEIVEAASIVRSKVARREQGHVHEVASVGL
jgi:hypothetical protein